MSAEPFPEPHPICERCWHPIQDGELFVRLGHVSGSNLAGDVFWRFVYIHPYAADGCSAPCQVRAA